MQFRAILRESLLGNVLPLCRRCNHQILSFANRVINNLLTNSPKNSKIKFFVNLWIFFSDNKKIEKCIFRPIYIFAQSLCYE